MDDYDDWCEDFQETRTVEFIKSQDVINWEGTFKNSERSI